MSPFPFDAVVFDLDGTLVATERYWPDAARAATRAFLEERGIERRIPSTAEWMEMVGTPLECAFDVAFSDLSPRDRAALIGACVKEEQTLLQRGRAALLAGVPETLEELKQRGVRLGVASNCGSDYLASMMGPLGLDRWIEEARCLQSRGIGGKADMIQDLIHTFGTRSVVMVGDRRSDRDSAWANGIPHVHIPRGYGGLQEAVDAEAVLDAVDQVPRTLEERTCFMHGVLDQHGHAASIAVDGMPLAGASLFARDLASAAAHRGDRAEVLEGDEGEVRIHLVADEECLVRRARGERSGPGPVERLMGEALPAYRARFPDPPSGALVVDGTNPILPSLLEFASAEPDRS
ncbi:MAG: HAD family hydrolase [Planctomycetota bacterium]|nr:HAD family hydrolase [Planctomycetota bacterium]